MGRGTEPRASTALGTSQRPSNSPKLPGLSTLPAPGFWLLQGPEQDPLDGLGTTKPREGPAGPRWPGRGGRGGEGVKPGASWAANSPGKWGSPQALPHGEGAAAKSPVLWSANAPPGEVPAALGQFGAPKASCPQGRTPPCPRTRLPTKICSATAAPCEEKPEQRLGQWQTRREGKKKKPWQFSAGFYLTWRQRAALCEGGTEAAHGNFLAFPLNRGFFTTSKFR